MASPAIRGISRLVPPAGLQNEAEVAVWLQIVNARPAEWFGREHVAMLANYCRHAVASDVIAAQLDEIDPKALKDRKVLERYATLRKLLHDEVRSLHNLARSMRLTQQSLYVADKAATIEARKVERRPWANEE